VQDFKGRSGPTGGEKAITTFEEERKGKNMPIEKDTHKPDFENSGKAMNTTGRKRTKRPLLTAYMPGRKKKLLENEAITIEYQKEIAGSITSGKGSSDFTLKTVRTHQKH